MVNDDGTRAEKVELVLVRHGATEWSASGRHTGRTDLPLTDEGREQAEHLRDPLRAWHFTRVLTSPMQRAVDTAHIVGLGAQAIVDDDLHEWDYGDYEGITTADIRKTVPGWTVWNGTCPHGETVDQVSARADRVIATVTGADGPVAIFSHGHFLRVLTARWLDLPAVDGRLFALDTATFCVLAHEHETRVVDKWNV